MRRITLFAATAAFAAAAAAQQYKWVDQNGRVQYGDHPPAGVKATPLRAPGGPAAPAAAPKAEARKPLTVHEQEAEFRKRQLEAGKDRDKQEAAAQAEAEKKKNCAIAQENVRQLESGQRIAHMNAQGERYFIEDDQRAKELVQARKSVADWCS